MNQSARRARTSVRLLATAILAVATGVTAGCEESKPQPEAGQGAATQSTAALKAAELEAKIKAEIAAKRAEEEQAKAASTPIPTEGECADGKNVDFHHKGLEAEIRRKLEKPEGAIAKSELAKVKSVNLAKGEALDYLDPCVFPYLTGVKDLFLGPGKLSDISALSKMTRLESLRATANQVSDISVLGNMKQLDRLDLANTLVSDITVIGGLKNLTELQLDGSKVTDIGALANHPKLERLTLNRTGVKDVRALKTVPTLKSVNVSGSAVTEPESIARRGLEVIDEAQ